MGLGPWRWPLELLSLPARGPGAHATHHLVAPTHTEVQRQTPEADGNFRIQDLEFHA